MGNGAVKTIVLMMVLVVLSFVIGAQITDGVKDSMGAFMLIGTIALGFVMLMLGERSLALMVALPSVFYDVYALPGMGGTRNHPVNFAISGAIFAYIILMWGMRYVRFRWRGALVLDVSVFLLVLYYIGNYIAYPTSIQAFSEDAEYVGGMEYVWLALAFLYYIAISSVDLSAEKLPQLMYRTYWGCVWVHVGYLGVAAATGQLTWILSIALSGQEGRVSEFNHIIPLLIYYCYASAPVGNLVSSARSLGILGFCSYLLMLGGRREIFLATGLAVTFFSFLKKEFLGIFVVLIAFYIGCLGLSAQDVLMSAPHPVQRVLTVLPGIKVHPSIVQGTEGSSETRREIWRYGLDPRTGFIKDYIWGDGFRTSTAVLSRQGIATMRNAGRGNPYGGERQAYTYARGGLWHNGCIYAISHTGVVGLVLVLWLLIIGMVMTYSVSEAYRGTRYYPAIMALILPWSAFALSFVWGSSALFAFFSCWTFLGLIKLMYCAARETGRLHPLFVQQHYVPLMIQQVEAQHAAASET